MTIHATRGAACCLLAAALSSSAPTNGAFTAVAAGSDFTCGLEAGGVAYCWGANSLGQLGSGSTTSSPTPVAVAGGVTFTALSAGGYFACGLAEDGGAYCWGNRRTGALGDGARPGGATQPTPLRVLGDLAFASVSAGKGGVLGTHACGVTRSGAAYCWGGNTVGQLGDGSRTDRTAPVAVAGGLTFKTVSAGGSHSCGLTTDQNVYCWGDNRYGQLGNGSRDPSNRPVLVTRGRGFTAVSAGRNFTCGLRITGGGFCWGIDVEGELGAPGTSDCKTDPALSGPERCSLVPVRVSGKHAWVALNSGGEHACAVTTQHQVYCWGFGNANQLGTGSAPGTCDVPGLGGGTHKEACATTPVRVASDAAFTTVSPGAHHTCAVAADGAAYCWGEGKKGQLGTGTTTDSPAPVRVAARP